MLCSTEGFSVVWKNPNKNLASMKAVQSTDKLIDFESEPHFVRLYIGHADERDWWGDDWNDVPYEHNAGTVYSRFVSCIVDIAFPAECDVLEPCDGTFNSSWCKKDMKERHVPMMVVDANVDPSGRASDMFEQVQSADALRLYMGDSAKRAVKALVDRFGAQILAVYENDGAQE